MADLVTRMIEVCAFNYSTSGRVDDNKDPPGGPRKIKGCYFLVLISSVLASSHVVIL